MLNFISFGSGSSGNCYYLFTATDGLIIDAGIGIRTLKKYFREYGLSFSSVRNILITHDHADHIKSVGILSRDCNIPVYATPEVHAGIERNYCVQKKISKEQVRCIDKDQTITIGDFTVTPFEVPHDSSDNVGYRIEYRDVVFCIITDAGCVTDVMKPYIADANYLVVEANYDEDMLLRGSYPLYLKNRISSKTGHLSNNACAQAVVENMTSKLKRVWLCHLSEENNHPELARKTIDSVLLEHGIITGKDICLDVLKRKTPSEICELDGKRE